DIMLEQAVFEVVNPQAVRDRWQALLGFPPLGEQGLDVGGQQFIFREGAANQLTELVFRVTTALKGQRFRVGNGVYRFT
ncbi:glyoxalase-like domain protein, partial [Klebsiella pneumoniae]